MVGSWQHADKVHGFEGSKVQHMAFYFQTERHIRRPSEPSGTSESFSAHSRNLRTLSILRNLSNLLMGLV